ncbi:MAG: glucosamine-6-phosphate deaminase [Tissierellia bacterium]|nr:glucosamine-6-phosphate deaminase [Tissierellia bacterium]
MKIIAKKDKDAVAQAAAEIYISALKENPDMVLGLATGSTPLDLYAKLIEANKKGDISFDRVKTFNLDNYIGLPADHEGSYEYYMQENFFNHIDIDPENCHIPPGISDDFPGFCQDYEAAIQAAGGIDLMLLGVGENGHIAFNEPAHKLQAMTHVAQLSPNTIQVNSRFFDRVEDVPTQAVSMGVGSILRSRKIVLLATGTKKKPTIQKLLQEDLIDPAFPISFLKAHPDATLIIEEDYLK